MAHAFREQLTVSVEYLFSVQRINSRNMLPDTYQASSAGTPPFSWQTFVSFPGAGYAYDASLARFPPTN
jgi:hypothetical protein